MKIDRSLLQKMTAAGLVVAALSGLAAAEPTAGSDWPRFLGPPADGKSTETGISTTWSKSGPPLLWTVEAGEGYAGPVVADGRLFLFDRRGGNVRLTALDARTGKELWRSEYASDYDDMYDFSDGPRASPLADTVFITESYVKKGDIPL